jgi:hypothetical protein
MKKIGNSGFGSPMNGQSLRWLLGGSDAVAGLCGTMPDPQN